jgi:hypothetical protein
MYMEVVWLKFKIIYGVLNNMNSNFVVVVVVYVAAEWLALLLHILEVSGSHLGL